MREDRPARITRAFKGEVTDVDQKKRTIVSVVTTDAIDRHKEVIDYKGIKLDNFRANPIVLWCHDGKTPIGKSLWIKRDGGKRGLVSKTLFAATDKAEEVFRLYSDEFLNGWSIGAQPDWPTYSGPTPEEIKARPELKDCYGIIRRCDLLEYSAVSIPANPEALGNEIGKAISKALRDEIAHAERWADQEIEATIAADEIEPPAAKTIELPPLVGRSFGEAREDVRRAIGAMLGNTAAKQSVGETLDRLKGRP